MAESGDSSRPQSMSTNLTLRESSAAYARSKGVLEKRANSCHCELFSLVGVHFAVRQQIRSELGNSGLAGPIPVPQETISFVLARLTMKNAWRFVVECRCVVCVFHARERRGRRLVRGRWDPGFGSILPGLNWSVSAELAGAGRLHRKRRSRCWWHRGPGRLSLRLYNDGYTRTTGTICPRTPLTRPAAATWVSCDSSVSSDPYFQARCNGTFGTYYAASMIRVVAGNVVGFDGGDASQLPTLTWPLLFTSDVPPNSWPSSANFNQFGLYFTTNGPVLTCATCEPPTIADTSHLTQFLVTYLDSGARSLPTGMVVRWARCWTVQGTTLARPRCPSPARWHCF